MGYTTICFAPCVALGRTRCGHDTSLGASTHPYRSHIGPRPGPQVSPARPPAGTLPSTPSEQAPSPAAQADGAGEGWSKKGEGLAGSSVRGDPVGLSDLTPLRGMIYNRNPSSGE